MDSRRAETYVSHFILMFMALAYSSDRLEALSAYIQTQKSMFSRAEADIERLRKLREDALIQPKAFTENIGSKVCSAPGGYQVNRTSSLVILQLNGPSVRLSEQQAPPLQNELHWQVFSSCGRGFAILLLPV